jgi:hypothetical protein
VNSESGDDAALHFTALTAENGAKVRFTALFGQAQAHVRDLMAWWDANRAEYVRNYDCLNADERRLVVILEQLSGRE